MKPKKPNKPEKHYFFLDPYDGIQKKYYCKSCQGYYLEEEFVVQKCLFHYFSKNCEMCRNKSKCVEMCG